MGRLEARIYLKSIAHSDGLFIGGEMRSVNRRIQVKDWPFRRHASGGNPHFTASTAYGRTGFSEIERKIRKN
jgi:hypothetical protein